MALMHAATLSPSKLELLHGWLPRQSWWDGVARETQGAFRLDDPDGEVGIELFLLGGGSSEDAPALLVPVTYRAVALEGADEHLVGTMEHSVLGTRWAYDGCADPVFARVLATTILTGGTQAVELVDRHDGREPQERRPTATAQGSGSADTEVPQIAEVGRYDEGPLTIVNAGPLELVVARVVGTDVEAAQSLAVTWSGGTDVTVAGVRPA